MGVCTSKANRNKHTNPHTQNTNTPNLPHLSSLNHSSVLDISKGGAVTITHKHSHSNPLLSPHKLKHSQYHSQPIIKTKLPKSDITPLAKTNYNSVNQFTVDYPKRLVLAYIHQINIGTHHRYVPSDIHSLILTFYAIQYKVYALPHSHSKNNPKFQRLKSVEYRINCKEIKNIYALNSQYIIKSDNEIFNLTLLKTGSVSVFNDSNHYKTHFEQTPNIKLVASSKNQTFIKFGNQSIYTTEKVYTSDSHSTLAINQKKLYKLCNLHFKKTVKENIVSIECGTRHTLLLSSHGRVYAMGNNDSGQCGLGGLMLNAFIAKPTLITKFVDKNCKIVSISCHDKSSVCVDGTHKYLWCWGDTIAYSNVSGQCICEPKIYLLDSVNNASINVSKAKCNGNTTVAIDESGFCYILGEMMCGNKKRLQSEIRFQSFDIGMHCIFLVGRDQRIYKLRNENGIYRIYKLGNKVFPDLKSECTVHSVVIANESTVVIFSIN